MMRFPYLPNFLLLFHLLLLLLHLLYLLPSTIPIPSAPVPISRQLSFNLTVYLSGSMTY
jgi:hypothetical protein